MSSLRAQLTGGSDSGPHDADDVRPTDVLKERAPTPKPKDAALPSPKVRASTVFAVVVAALWAGAEDERFAILTISERGTGKDGNALYIRDLSKGDATFRPVVSVIDNDSYGVVDNVGDKLLLQTNRKAPNWRVVLVDPAHPEETNWKDVLPEKPEPLDTVSTAGGKLFATYLKDVMTRAYVYRLDGTLENEVALPGLGSAGGFGGQERGFLLSHKNFLVTSFVPSRYPTFGGTWFRSKARNRTRERQPGAGKEQRWRGDGNPGFSPAREIPPFWG
jgi:hypothetical protein